MAKHHQVQAQKLLDLGIPHRAAARDLDVPASTFSNYLKSGHLPSSSVGAQHAAPLPERLDRYITMKTAAQKSATPEHREKPMIGAFSGVALSLSKTSDATGIDYITLKRGIYEGRWPDETTYKHFAKWLDHELNRKKEATMLTKISLDEEVLQYFGLARDPFSFEMLDHDDILETKELKRAENKIMSAIDNGGWVAITGEVGSGKSTLIKRVKQRLASSKTAIDIVEPRLIEKQFLGASHICDAILADLNVVSRSRGTLEFKARKVGEILQETHRDKRKVVILIDEAHLLRPDALLALKRIYEIEIGFRKLLAIVLVGQTRLARVLKTDIYLREVSQRVDLYEIGSLNGSLGSYLRHKLDRAGANGKEIFESAAIKEMGKRFDTPLAINNLAAQAMISAHGLGERKVSVGVLDTVKGGL